MIHSIEEFLAAWKQESDGTLKIMGALTDESLGRAVTDDHRTIGRMAWHIICTIPEMVGRTGLKIDGPKENDPVPTSAAAIKAAYDRTASSLAEQIKKNWTDATLQVEDDMYGYTWKRGQTLAAVITHEVHHRGQMTVLMRQAGLSVPGVMGPAREEWSQFGMQPPVV